MALMAFSIRLKRAAILSLSVATAATWTADPAVSASVVSPRALAWNMNRQFEFVGKYDQMKLKCPGYDSELQDGHNLPTCKFCQFVFVDYFDR